MWVKFSDNKPQEGPYNEGSELITTFKGKSGHSFENWTNWKNSHLNICFPDGTGHITHWWDGISDMEKASNEWFKGKNDQAD